MQALNIGAGRTAKKPGTINADFHPGPNIDVVFDATKRWPFKDNSISRIDSCHMLEHLPEPTTFFREAHRVLCPSPVANMFIRLPYGPSDAGIGDITHLRQYVPQSFACFQPGYNDAINNPQYDEAETPFSVMAICLVVDKGLKFVTRWPFRKWAMPKLKYLWNAYEEMIIQARALKTQQDVDAWKVIYTANVVPICFGIMEDNQLKTFNVNF